MADEIIDFDAQSEQQDVNLEGNDVINIGPKIASLNAKAVMPNGQILSRGEILRNLGLNPNTSPTAWLAVIGCGSNASALLPGDLQRIAVNKVRNASTILARVAGLGDPPKPTVGAGGESSGFASGGEAPNK